LFSAVASCVPNKEKSSIVANTPRLAPVVVSVTIVVTVVVVTVDIMADNWLLLRCHSAYKVYGRRHNQKQKNIRQAMRKTNTQKAPSFKHQNTKKQTDRKNKKYVKHLKPANMESCKDRRYRNKTSLSTIRFDRVVLKNTTEN